ncbi:MAG: Fe-S protein assembly co-chaperone HscB [Bacteroidota bacterium]|nr:Fe-S protein assembly co-chaperone HscB [Bacteroidota bacterium]MDP4230758.1 Fe-S protein assembly co-chaperone HscB [Bacteroidota bacterium]MDP4236438.1 Fe-S protein assembly co-chaperone HscB [Bacteroidota bacterium]
MSAHAYPHELHMHDYFLTLGVERTFSFENAALERRFHDLQRQSHPDRFSGSSGGILESALERSSDINEAYRTLRDPLRRSKHLLALYGFSVEQSKQVPMDLLELVMNAQEKVAELDSASEDSKAEILASIDPLLDELAERRAVIDLESDKLRAEWDALPSHSEPGAAETDAEKIILQQLASRLASRAYVTTLLDSLSAASKGESMVLKH